MSRPRLLDEEIATRFWAKVQKTDSCWLWTASLRDGYGIFAIPGVTSPQRAHRVAYELVIGPIPAGLTLDHLCRQRACVRSEHLEPVTLGENLRRSPLVAFVVNARKTHCPRNHPYDEVNTRVYKGRRFCRRCQAVARDKSRGRT